MAVWVGLIALAGLDAETGVVLLLYLTIAYREARAEGRLRSMADLFAIWKARARGREPGSDPTEPSIPAGLDGAEVGR